MRMRFRSTFTQFAVVTMVASSFNSFLQPVYAGAILNPANGHYYDWIENRLTWEEARIEAESQTHLGLTGHLTTITSQSEQDFLDAQFSDREGWLGGLQLDGAAEPDQGFVWYTGEPFIYTNWGNDEPNNIFASSPNENRISLEISHPTTIKIWNDMPHEFTTSGYFVEYSAVPEPGTLTLVGCAALILGCRRLRRRKKTSDECVTL